MKLFLFLLALPYLVVSKSNGRYGYDAWKLECTSVGQHDMNYCVYIVCMENTGCYKDFVNYQELDKCIDDAFEMGPMHYCETTLRTILKEKPNDLSPCVVEYLNDKNPIKFDCVSIDERGKCFLKDVEKYCEPKLLPMYKEHQNLRLYNRACDGRLRYKDWDYSHGQDYALQFTPGGLKVMDAKRGMLKNSETEEEVNNNTTVV
uniref:DUF19 domain-containing protein n=1 Tax=Caenorhabditis tropicalis TaxID=1561998 RepID=A0A1I7UWD2_9PELO